jgi:Methyltransferase domain
MRIEESRAVREIVLGLGLPQGSTCLNLGSSSRTFRERAQPHIEAELLQPLRQAAVRFVHCDLKPDEGVDLVGDVHDPAFQQRLAREEARLLLCCNMLEHLDDPRTFAAACSSFVPPGGYAVVSVPLSYPYHPDPIDTMLRITPEEIAAFFPEWSLAHGQTVVSTSFLQDSLARPGGAGRLVEHMLKLLVPFYRPSTWRRRAHRALWLFRPYRISVALLRRKIR